MNTMENGFESERTSNDTISQSVALKSLSVLSFGGGVGDGDGDGDLVTMAS